MSEPTEPIQRGEFLEPWVCRKLTGNGAGVILNPLSPAQRGYYAGKYLLQVDDYAMYQAAKHQTGIQDESLLSEMAEGFAGEYAERIALCVNFCRGISNEDLARGVVAVGQATEKGEEGERA